MRKEISRDQVVLARARLAQKLEKAKQERAQHELHSVGWLYWHGQCHALREALAELDVILAP